MHANAYILSLYFINSLVSNSKTEAIFLQNFEDIAHLKSVTVFEKSETLWFQIFYICSVLFFLVESLKSLFFVPSVMKFYNDVYLNVLWLVLLGRPFLSRNSHPSVWRPISWPTLLIISLPPFSLFALSRMPVIWVVDILYQPSNFLIFSLLSDTSLSFCSSFWNIFLFLFLFLSVEFIVYAMFFPE